ncbi:C40 family peptidase [Alkalihalobacterium chitinilyticum]|uniref:Peptidoglycan-binding protein n=1 Tax=Alkalihalobacterium chitinilyticum TaxID=2980103 RepID=A0ABT5VK31_9BACI|nr:peptidoglycan-binding protein [Alkalihalobacterium chitinilyticum]MDE5415807.1 peptidoglycan-binding protein [Alkalihalobacterium chitinilyticum]
MSTKSVVKKAVISSTFATGIVLTAPLMVDAALGDQPLKKGMNHPDVKELQEALRAKGYFTFHTSTGFYGTITEEAVRQFQRTHGIQTTGVANTSTLNLLLSSNSQNRQATNTQIASSSTTSTSGALAQTTGLLRAGSQGQAVTELQERLKEAGHFNHQVTGYFGRVTQSALRDYQKKHGLTIDGIAGPQTISHILGRTTASQASTPAQSTPPPAQPAPTQTTNAVPASGTTATTNTQVLRIGASGATVTQLQEALKQLGHFDHRVTGYFGSVTHSAVRSFQRSQQITVDGIVGPQTLRAIEAAANGDTKTVQSERQIKSDTVTAQPSPPAQQGFNVMNLIADAADLVGTPYLWGGTTPRGFDCSGFIQYVFRNQGVSIPRTAAQQWAAGRSVDKPSVGDLVFFQTYTNGPSHNGIYIGNNQFIHSGSSTGVTVTSMSNSYWSQRYLGAKRLH